MLPSPPMKSLRLVLLVLLALLMPARAALAAAMLCPVGSSGSQTELRLHGEVVGHAVLHGTDPAGDVHSAHAAHHDHGGPADQCSVCSAFCCVTPLLFGVPSVATPELRCAAFFPEPVAPVPSFIAEGPERPPRSA